jgi:hypothetical protein
MTLAPRFMTAAVEFDVLKLWNGYAQQVTLRSSWMGIRVADLGDTLRAAVRMEVHSAERNILDEIDTRAAALTSDIEGKATDGSSGWEGYATECCGFHPFTLQTQNVVPSLAVPKLVRRQGTHVLSVQQVV